MSCNWELFELRLRVWLKAEKYPQRGYVGLGMMFWEVFLDLSTFGIQPKPKDSADICGFKAIFEQLVQKRVIPFSCNKNNADNQAPFGRIQTASRKGETFPAAFLFLHRRDQSDLTGETTGIGILLEEVFVPVAVSTPTYYAHLFGKSASKKNF